LPNGDGIVEVGPMFSSSSVLCSLICFIQLAGSYLAISAGRFTPDRNLSSFEYHWPQGAACLLEDRAPESRRDRQSDDAAELQDNSDDDENPDEIAFLWASSLTGMSRQTLADIPFQIHLGFGTSSRSRVLRC
jgi:hypothetical protein